MPTRGDGLGGKRPARRRALAAGAADEAAQGFVRRRQIRRIGEPHEHHVGGGERPRRILHLLHALQRAIARPASAPASTASCANSPPRRRSSSVTVEIVGARLGNELQPRDEMDEFGELDEDLARIGAGIVKRLQIGERRRDIAASSARRRGR